MNSTLSPTIAPLATGLSLSSLGSLRKQRHLEQCTTRRTVCLLDLSYLVNVSFSRTVQPTEPAFG